MRRDFKVAIAASGIVAAVTVWAAWPRLDWPDRRPFGAVFLASYAHRSPSNPRGWLNAPQLDVVGPDGPAHFRKALWDYADRAVMVLRSAGAQGMVAWDIEGEEFPQKISYIGDPRLVETLAPEMAPVVDEFFRRFRNAGLRVGVTIRPQRFVREGPRQQMVWDSGSLLLGKIDYARRRWGATLFYIDSNAGALWPGEMLTLAWLARQRPDVLLIPEHHQPLYYAFSAPYGALRDGSAATSGLVRLLYPHAFQVLSVSDAAGRRDEVAQTYRNGDVLLFPGWFWSKETTLVKSIAAP